MQTDRKKALINWIVIAAVFLFAILFSRLFQGNTVVSRFTEEGLTLTGPESFNAAVTYSEMTEIGLKEEFDYGSAAGGSENSRCRYGAWKNEAYGAYTLAVRKETKKAIVIKAGERVVVFNAEDDQTTETLYEAILQKTGLPKTQ